MKTVHVELWTEPSGTTYEINCDETGRPVVVCFRHPDRIAVKSANVPCAPGGVLPLCDECAKPENAEAVFRAYQNKYHGAERIYAFKSQN